MNVFKILENLRKCNNAFRGNVFKLFIVFQINVYKMCIKDKLTC